MEENKTVETEEVEQEQEEEVEVEVKIEDVEPEPEPKKKKGFWPSKEQVLHGLKVVGIIAVAFAAGAATTIALGCHLANQRELEALPENGTEETE